MNADIAGYVATGTPPATRYLAWLTAALLLAVAAAFAWGDPALALHADPQLARLLRGMALLKAVLVIVAFCAIAWRMRWPISNRLAAGYAIGIVAMGSATAFVWQLTFIAAAAFVFHVGGFLLLGLAYRDGTPLANTTPTNTATQWIAAAAITKPCHIARRNGSRVET